MSDASKQTIVLVHGAHAESSSWNGSIPALRRTGHAVIAVANPLRRLECHTQHLRDVLAGIDGPVVLAGHSYGGFVMSHAADGNPDVVALVFIASFLAEPDENPVQLVEKLPGARLGEAAQPATFHLPNGEEAVELIIDRARYHELFAGDVDAEIAEQMAVTQRPFALSAFETPATRAAWRATESWSLAATQDPAIPTELSRFMASRADAHLVEIDASHAVTVSQPEAVTGLILEAAHATAR